jgi:hypothetical protein
VQCEIEKSNNEVIKWYSWRSPVGRAVFIVGICISVFILALTAVIIKDLIKK